MFRSTGSYEPDRKSGSCEERILGFRSTGSYEPDQFGWSYFAKMIMFRSTGSYEPDHSLHNSDTKIGCFDPQALTSLTKVLKGLHGDKQSFDPQALTSLTQSETNPSKGYGVSIHRLLRA